jgi:hypothetical protein
MYQSRYGAAATTTFTTETTETTTRVADWLFVISERFMAYGFGFQ